MWPYGRHIETDPLPGLEMEKGIARDMGWTTL